MSNTNNKRIVLVTGATGGLGTAMCKKLLKDGFRVVGNYVTHEKAEKWTKDMNDAGCHIDLFHGDVSTYEGAKKMIQDIEAKTGPIDTLAIFHLG